MKKIHGLTLFLFAWLNTVSFAYADGCDNPLQVSQVDYEPLPSRQIIIIIDDLGHSLHRGKKAIELPGHITYAVIPFTTHAQELADRAHMNGKEVMVHAPMSTVQGDPLGVGGLTAHLSRREFNERLNDALDDVPHAQGINNHMGSDLTQRRLQMGWLMQELRWQELYFVDSRTSGRSVAATVATEFNVPNLSREIFLDNDLETEALARQFAEAVAYSKKHGRAVVIAHPHPETISYLQRALPTLRDEGIAQLTVSQALKLADREKDQMKTAGAQRVKLAANKDVGAGAQGC
ncbi:MAG: divergent polysaccharide deacetylase family protein [Halioglobus sp.]